MIFLFSLILAFVVGFFALKIWARTAPAAELGTEDGRLKPCPESPNCVTSYTDDAEHGMDPLPLPSAVDSTEAVRRLKALVDSLPRARVTTEWGSYLACEFRSRIIGFVDDVEFLVDEGAGLIHFRSASRLGYSDMGVNRKRMEEIARLWQERLEAGPLSGGS
jgi:uncharacterized protein (DUF1499 family)